MSRLMEGEAVYNSQRKYSSTSPSISATPFSNGVHLGGIMPRIRPVPRLKNQQNRFKKVNATIALWYGFIVFVALHHVWKISSHSRKREFGFFAGLLFPLGGWLADGYLTRYKLIRSGIFVIWVSALLLPVVYLPLIISSSYAGYLRIILWLLLGLGTCCCQANLIQFGIDQLKDSSSREIVAYIKWYMWTYFASKVVVEFTQTCIQYEFIWSSILYLPLLFSAALCIDFWFNHLLVKEHVTQNPLPQIFQVLKYAAKNRYPQLRSSYVYWSNKCCSRINLAKSVFGGPFTSQQVEDVKSFFQMSVLTLLGGIFLSVNIAMDWLIIRLYVKSLGRVAVDTTCLINSLYFKSGYIFVTLFVPICECVILPLVRTYLPYLKILGRVSLGGVICLLYLAIISGLVLSKKLCVMNCNSSEDKSLYWFTFLSIMNCSGLYTTAVTGIEFVCAQCPSNMKGVIIGLFYFFYSASFVSVLKIDEYYFKLHLGHIFIVITHMIIAIATAVVFCASVFLYKARQRNHDQEETTITEFMQ